MIGDGAMNAAVRTAVFVSGVAQRVAPERRGARARRGVCHFDGGVCPFDGRSGRGFITRVAAAKDGGAGEGGWPQWRSTPEPNSPFDSMFEAASAMAGGNQPAMDPPRKTRKSKSKKAVPGKTYDSWLEKDEMTGDDASTTMAITRDGCEDECDPAIEPDCVPSPYCSITFIDESEDDDGEGDFAPPMSDPRTAAGGTPSPSPPTSAWPPWLEDTMATTHVSGPACDISATVEVCAGKQCARNGLASDVMNSLRGNMPPGWTLQPGRKCMGMCKRACVVRVTGEVNQVVHTGVTSATAAISVLPGRSFSTMAGLSLDDYIPASMEKERETRAETPRSRGAPVAAASGLFAAAAAAVDRGIDLDESARGEGDASGVKTREKKKKRDSSVLLAARAASARVEDMGVAAYSRELKEQSNKEFPFSY